MVELQLGKPIGDQNDPEYQLALWNTEEQRFNNWEIGEMIWIFNWSIRDKNWFWGTG